MSGRTQGQHFGPSDRIAAWARATEKYAEGLEDDDLANVYWGKSLGLWQAFEILTAEVRLPPGRSPRPPASHPLIGDPAVPREELARYASCS